MAADSFAIVATLFRLNALIEMKSEPEANWLQDPNVRVSFIATMVYLIFTSMDFLDENDDDYILKTHPSPMSRAGLSMVNLGMASEIFYGEDLSDTHKICQSAFKAVEVSLLNVAGGALTEDEVSRYGGEAERSFHQLFLLLRQDKINRDYTRMSNISWGFILPGVI